jgi:hypothetical protein
VGTSKRYVDSNDARMGDKAGRHARCRAGYVDAARARARRRADYPRPETVPVFAWVRYDGIPIRVSARVVARTEKAVAVEWKAPSGLQHAWVWSSAVEPRRID